MWAGLLQRWRSLPHTVSSLSSSFLNSTVIIPNTTVTTAFSVTLTKEQRIVIILEVFISQNDACVLAAAVYMSSFCSTPRMTVFLSVYLDLISMMPIEPPGNN